MRLRLCSCGVWSVKNICGRPARSLFPLRAHALSLSLPHPPSPSPTLLLSLSLPSHPLSPLRFPSLSPRHRKSCSSYSTSSKRKKLSPCCPPLPQNDAPTHPPPRPPPCTLSPLHPAAPTAIRTRARHRRRSRTGTRTPRPASLLRSWAPRSPRTTPPTPHAAGPRRLPCPRPRPPPTPHPRRSLRRRPRAACGP